MAVSFDVSQPSVTQCSGFSLFVPLNSLQCTDVTEQLGEQETGAKWHRENPARVKGSQELTHSLHNWWRVLACEMIIQGNLMTLWPPGSPRNMARWKSGTTTDGKKDFQETPMLCEVPIDWYFLFWWSKSNILLPQFPLLLSRKPW